MSLEVLASSDRATEIACDALLIGATQDGGDVALGEVARHVDESLDGSLTRYMKDSAYRAKFGELIVIPSMGRLPANAVAAVGLGPRNAVDDGVLRRAAGVAARRLSAREIVASALHMESRSDDSVRAATEGFLLGAYRFTKYKSKDSPPRLKRLVVLDERATTEIERAELTAGAVALARDLTNEPASSLTPQTFAEWAESTAAETGLEFSCKDENELESEGWGGVLSVGKGSARPPCLIELTHRTGDAGNELVLIGKGVTFDSGGLSLKDARNMEHMKTDMAGAAAVIGAMGAIGRLQPERNVRGIIPAAENMPGGSAIKPGDVIKHYGGHTSEVTNTDAEGRLMLGDVLAYASAAKPVGMVDVATLTGAMMVALGRKAAGLFGNDDEFSAEIEAAAQEAGERVWRMPLYDDYRPELDSEVADIKNSGPRYGGAIMAALFLKDFVGARIPWAHLDIAGAARAESDYDEVTRGGTGFATRTLIRLVERSTR